MSNRKQIQTMLNKVADKLALAPEEAERLMKKYRTLHGCRCSSNTCGAGHHVCHN